MLTIIDSKLNKVIAYMSELMSEGADITGFYIIQAHLTSLKVLISPTTILMSLFNLLQLKKILQIAREQSKSIKSLQKGFGSNKKQSEIQNNQNFKLSITNIDMKPLQDLTYLVKKLLQTLQQWQILKKKTKQINLLVQLETKAPFDQLQVEQVKQDLINYLSELQLYKSATQPKINTSDELTASVQGQNYQRSTILDVSFIFEYVVRWCKQVTQEINDYKSVVQVTKEESSADLEAEHINAIKKSIFFDLVKGKASISPNRLKQIFSGKDKSSKDNIKKKVKKLQASLQLGSISSISTKSDGQSNSNCCSGKVLRCLNNKTNGKGETKCKKKEKQFCQCAIF